MQVLCTRRIENSPIFFYVILKVSRYVVLEIYLKIIFIYLLIIIQTKIF